MSENDKVTLLKSCRPILKCYLQTKKIEAMPELGCLRCVKTRHGDKKRLNDKQADARVIADEEWISAPSLPQLEGKGNIEILG